MDATPFTGGSMDATSAATSLASAAHTPSRTKAVSERGPALGDAGGGKARGPASGGAEETAPTVGMDRQAPAQAKPGREMDPNGSSENLNGSEGNGSNDAGAAVDRQAPVHEKSGGHHAAGGGLLADLSQPLLADSRNAGAAGPHAGNDSFPLLAVNVESGTSQSKSGTSVNLSNSGNGSKGGNGSNDAADSGERGGG